MKLSTQARSELAFAKAIKNTWPSSKTPPNRKWDERLRAWLCQEAPSTETFQVGNRFLTRMEIWEERIPYVTKVEPFSGFEGAFPSWIRARADELEQWKQAASEYYASPEMQLATAQRTISENLKIRQKRVAFMNCALQAARMWLDFKPEERQELRNSLAETGALECYGRFKTLGAAILTQHPDAEKRNDALAGAKVTDRKLAAGADLAAAFAAKDRVHDNRQYARETIQQLSPKVIKALADAGGKKALAARHLGISRAKMRRLTGVQM